MPYIAPIGAGIPPRRELKGKDMTARKAMTPRVKAALKELEDALYMSPADAKRPTADDLSIIISRAGGPGSGSEKLLADLVASFATSPCGVGHRWRASYELALAEAMPRRRKQVAKEVAEDAEVERLAA